MKNRKALEKVLRAKGFNCMEEDDDIRLLIFNKHTGEGYEFADKDNEKDYGTVVHIKYPEPSELPADTIIALGFENGWDENFKYGLKYLQKFLFKNDVDKTEDGFDYYGALYCMSADGGEYDITHEFDYLDNEMEDSENKVVENDDIKIPEIKLPSPTHFENVLNKEKIKRLFCYCKRIIDEWFPGETTTISELIDFVPIYKFGFGDKITIEDVVCVYSAIQRWYDGTTLFEQFSPSMEQVETLDMTMYTLAKMIKEYHTQLVQKKSE